MILELKQNNFTFIFDENLHEHKILVKDWTKGPSTYRSFICCYWFNPYMQVTFLISFLNTIFKVK